MHTADHSHPERPVRHSYPLAIRDASLTTAAGLVARTLPYAAARFGLLLGLSLLSVLWWTVSLTGAAWLSAHAEPLGWAWLAVGLGSWSAVWWLAGRYFLYLLKAGHIAVLTELITTGQIAGGEQGMLRYGKQVVQRRLGEVHALFALDVTIHAVVRAFNRALDGIANFLPIPGLDSLMGVVRAVVFAATTYIDETLLSYSLARGDENRWRSARDGLLYYAQNSKEVLKTSVWVVVLDKTVTFLLWLLCLAPAFGIGRLLPSAIGGWAGLIAFAFAVMVASSLRAAFLKPLLLTMVMTKFHVSVEGQTIHPEWDARLTSVSSRFAELKDKALGGEQPAPADRGAALA